jgi:asparagine synthase (glutamine-hydrolysing)
MCGIAGLWRLNGRPINRAEFTRFVDSLQHRGPDGRGLYFDDGDTVALGHRRLAILDTSEVGNQPMGYADSRYWLVFNGEIYNFLELRSELEGHGFQFRSQSDSEVILAAYIHWGPDMLPRFNGMWALAIYDRAEKSLFMARDRFGVKPFHYQLDAGQLAFASELKSFKYLEGYQPEIDTETAGVFLDDPFGVEGSQRTILRGVARLQGGHWALFKNGQLTVRRWWNTLDHLVEVPARVEDQAARFRELFEDSVKLRLRSDVPVGTCLSGGFDSTAVVCALARIGREEGHARQAREWQQTFVATFPGAENDERPQAEAVIQYAGVKGNFFPMDATGATDQIDRVLTDFDDLYFNLPTPVWLIYKYLREHGVVVSLDGHGADEMMGGYKPPAFLLLHEAPHWLLHPGRNIQRLGRALSYERAPMTSLTARLKTALKLTLKHHPDLASARRLTRSFREKRRDQVLRFRTDPARPRNPGFDMVAGGDKLPSHWGPVNRELYRMFHTTVLPTILRNFDRLSTAHGIEVRMPFMDWRLVCFVMSLPDQSKIADEQTKRVAREAMRGLIPEEIRASKIKIGFNSPLPIWLRGPLKPWLNELLDQPHASACDLVDLKSLRAHINATTAQNSMSWPEAELIWRYVNYLWYADRFLKK